MIAIWRTGLLVNTSNRMSRNTQWQHQPHRPTIAPAQNIWSDQIRSDH